MFSTKKVYNEQTGEVQTVLKTMSKEQEIRLGLQSAPEMIQMHGGQHPSQDAKRQRCQKDQREIGVIFAFWRR